LSKNDAVFLRAARGEESMRATLDYLMGRGSLDNGYSPEEAERILAPDECHQYNLGQGSVAARTIHRGVETIGPDGHVEYASQGGCRVEIVEDGEHPDVSDAAYNSGSLAANQTMKNILSDLPFGGAKADVFVPRSVFDDPARFRAVLGSFVQHHAGVIWRGDGIGPDMNLGPEDMDFMAETLVSMSHDEHDYTRFTGKSVDHHGQGGRVDATSRGMLKAIQLFAEAEGWSLEDATVAIEGSGNVGYHIARLAHQAGARIMGMSDVHQSVLAHNLRGDGLVPDRDIRFAGRGIASFNQDLARSNADPKDLHQAPVDLFIFAGPSGSVTAARGNIGKLVAPRRAFGANTPEDRAALEHDEQNGFVNYPDIVINPGGVIGSYVERITGGTATEDEVHTEIDRRIQHAVALTLAGSVRPSDYVRAANREAVRLLHNRDHHLVAA
jgi:glutamate dehydrogenase (NADP+)